jgi:hypothetical protein
MLLIDGNGFQPVTLLSEGKNGSLPLKFRSIFTTCGTKNGNGRIYEKKLIERELKRLLPMIRERRLTGELDHPDSETISLKNVSHLVTNLYMEGNYLIGESEVLPTPAGQTLKTLLEAGVRIGISSRGTGGLEYDMKREAHIVQDNLKMVTWDMVADPSCQDAFPSLMEGRLHTTEEAVQDITERNRKEKVFLEALRRNLKK